MAVTININFLNILNCPVFTPLESTYFKLGLRPDYYIILPLQGCYILLTYKRCWSLYTRSHNGWGSIYIIALYYISMVYETKGRSQCKILLFRVSCKAHPEFGMEPLNYKPGKTGSEMAKLLWTGNNISSQSTNIVLCANEKLSRFYSTYFMM